ncbi:shikimate kinase [Breoghania sp.]|uniref:shikimate kinase n=1 Tax=Breoghania sp. TaxID=2065378 RepID=UPI002AA708BC|nr:shikimate kinase [Breoghania sp.]
MDHGPQEGQGEGVEALSDKEGDQTRVPDVEGVRTRLGKRTIVLVGMMGCGKSSVGRLLANRLRLPFVDADLEIEAAANLTIPEIFERHGEAYFRSGEHRVIVRLLGEGPQVLATGGGAFMNPETRHSISGNGISVWLKADFETLFARVSRRTHRPLLQTPDPAAVLRELLRKRNPIYEKADVSVDSRDVPHEQVVSDIVNVLDDFMSAKDAGQDT